MREILFRGKTIVTGRWIEGLLWKKKYDSNKIFISYFPDKDDNEDALVVDPETVCQYTGLTDKNGNKIWENDVCQYIETTSKGTVIVSETFIVKYGRHRDATGTNLGFYIEWLEEDNYRTDICFWAENREIEVIGNIFDNPELMEGGEADE